MVRGGSYGGGQSSLGYLFGDFENPTHRKPPTTNNRPPVDTPAQPPAAPPCPQPQTPAGNGNRTNNYHRADGQNCGNFVTDRPSTKVHSAPGGASSLGYLFGDTYNLTPRKLLKMCHAMTTKSFLLVSEPEVTKLCVEAQECMVAGRWLELGSLMLTSADLMFSNSKVSDKDLECIFTVICNLVTKTENVEEAFEIAKLISAKLIQQPNEKPALRMKILFNLYNLLENSNSKFDVYMKALSLALNGKASELIAPSFKKIDSFLKEWKVGVKEQRELYLGIANVLKETKNGQKDAFNFLTKYLATFSDEDANQVGEAKEEAVRSIVEFVKAPNMFQCDLLDMPAVGQLENDANYAPVYQLLKIFLTQKLDAYIEFQAANSDLLNSHGLVHEDCLAKMRLMSLLDLASDESGKIPYAVIKATLQINDDEVEMWVVKAITAKLIDGKMDQMNQVVIVSRYTDRVFGQHQWESLRTKLAIWKGNISSVISTIQANKITEDASSQAAWLELNPDCDGNFDQEVSSSCTSFYTFFNTESNPVLCLHYLFLYSICDYLILEIALSDVYRDLRTFNLLDVIRYF
ncbi:hypothetical protein ACFE04_007338 [Oxalis oulophora]